MVTYYRLVYSGSEKFAANSFLGKMTVEPLLELLIKEIHFFGMKHQQKMRRNRWERWK